MEGRFRRRNLPHWDVSDGVYFVTSCLAGSVSTKGLAELRQFRSDLEQRERPRRFSEPEWRAHRNRLLFARFDRILDLRPGVQYLADPRLAEVVRRSLYFFAGERYDLLSYVIMSSHFHFLFYPRPEWSRRFLNHPSPPLNPPKVGEFLSPSARAGCPTVDHDPCEGISEEARLTIGKNACKKAKRYWTPREHIMHSIRSFTANRCNQLLRRQGTFWQPESYDHVVRNEREFQRVLHYIEMNPVQAQLVTEPADWRWSSAYDRARWGGCPGDPLLEEAGQ